MRDKYIQNGLIGLGVFIALAFKVNFLAVVILAIFMWSND